MQQRGEEMRTFHADGFELDPVTGTVLLRYSFDGGEVRFEEEICLGGPVDLDGDGRSSLDRILQTLHIAAGTSYYKAFAPREIDVGSGPIVPSQLELASALYDEGLREFAFTNSLRVPNGVVVRAESSSGASRPRLSLPGGMAVPVGGGKDSIVVLEALRDLSPRLVAVNPPPAVRRTAEVSGLELITLTRKLDPALADLNRAGAMNGHVPITAILSLVIAAAGFVHGYSSIAMALESSADEPTRVVGGVEVNHQWSKSDAGTRMISAALGDIAPGLGYGSVLRELSELEISTCFATFPEYHHVFRSCNRAFRMDGAVDAWCCDCPKCRFVYLMLAPSLDRTALVSIFGHDMFDDDSQVAGFRDLVDPERKPFECVGTREESVAAFELVAADPEWSGSVVVESLRGATKPASPARGVGGRSPSEVLEIVRKSAEALAGPPELDRSDV